MLKETNLGKVATAAFIITAIVIGAKNYKQPGFWIGALALFLLGFSVKTYTKNEQPN